MKILITGSSGYLGNFLAVYFGKKGIQVIGTDLRIHPVVTDIPNFHFYECDIRDKEKLRKIFQNEKPTHVIHLAYLMDPIHDEKTEYDIDVKGSQYILEIANETYSVVQFILFSSASIYGADMENPDWFTEESPLQPRDYNYAIYKKEVEEWYGQFKKRSEMKLVIFRMCTAVGPSYYKKGGVVSSLANAPFLIQVGSRRNAVQFIHEDDVKVLVEKIIDDPEVDREVFNLGASSFSYIDEIAVKLNKKLYRIPLGLMKFFFRFLWIFHLSALTPAMAKLIAYPIAATPKKLTDRYQYQLQYDTMEALLDAIDKRKAAGRL